ncbi:hypothetical protein C4D60_Mb03t20770 [Musa balbisiana]|uniref:Heparanase-like protein 3 n=1 Tax=Musa balbisiana TaxID=52838 RepID=A0A4S8JBD3_MUSBA|nr:hypothetical protein C4D60_Mb03t20770 [Musa balbisiana]
MECYICLEPHFVCLRTERRRRRGEMGGGALLAQLLGFCFWGSLWLAGPVAAYSGGELGKAAVVVDGAAAIAVTDEDFVCATLDWWPPEKCDYGTCSWGLDSMLNLNLSNPILLNAVKAFSPLKLRLGGSLQDKVIYDTGNPRQPCVPFLKNTSEMFGFSQGCLPMSRWDELNEFFDKAGALIIFGLNALNGRVPESDGSLGGPWNYTNAASLIRYTVNKGYTIHGWELGNELSGSGVGARIGADQYAADVITLKSIINDIYQGFPVKPLVLAPGGFFDAGWFTELPPHSTLFKESSAAEALLPLPGLVKQEELTTVATIWYLDQLGMSATYNTKTYCRQSLVGGNYGLLNTTTFHPNPDYYSALLWHRLMGKHVLRTNFTGSRMTRAYSHCAKESQGITLLLINLSGNTTTEVFVTTKTAESTREEYHLTAKDGDIHSQTMLLNGHILAVDSDGHIPELEPVKVAASEPITVDPFSIVFAHIPYFHALACR